MSTHRFPARVPVACLAAGLALLAGCSGPKYEYPPRAYDLAETDGEWSPEGQRLADYYVLAYSELNVAGRRAPSCPFEVLEEVTARTKSLDEKDTWEEDKAVASARPGISETPLTDQATARDRDYRREELFFPERLESKLLDVLREKARRLGGDAIVDIVIQRSPDGSGIGVTVQNKEIAGDAEIEKITGKVIRFTDPDCRR
jgi:hypothetical protein